MVPRRDAEPLVEPVALPLPAGASSPTSGWSTRTAGAAEHDPEFELIDTGDLRRRPLLDRRGRLREGRPDRRLLTVSGHATQARTRHAARAADALVPQHLGVGRRRARRRAASRPERRARSTTEHPFLGRSSSSPTRARTASRPRLLFCDNETNAERLFGIAGPTRVPEGRDQRPRRVGRGDREPRADGTKAAFRTASRSPRARRSSSGCGCVRPRGPASAAGRTSPTSSTARAARGRRVLRRADAARLLRRRGDGDAPGVRRDAVGQAVLPLRRRSAGSTAIPRSRAPPEARRHGAQRPLAALRRLRHHLDARPVGVPVVRRLGPRLPLRRARARRPRVRQVPADAALPRVVPCTRTARSPRTSGRSTTSTRRCTRGRRCEVFEIDGGRDFDFLERIFDKLLSTSRGG